MVVPRYRCSIEVLNLNPAVKRAIILLLYHTFVEVLKDRSGTFGSISDLNEGVVQ
jgi:hypothetical protein